MTKHITLKITLLETNPLVWRKVSLPLENLTLRALHQVIQIAMGWENLHLFVFEIGTERYTDPSFVSPSHSRFSFNSDDADANAPAWCWKRNQED